MKKLLFSVDIFGYSPRLTIKKRSENRTIFGGIMTILLVVLSLIAICFFGQEIIFKESPSVNLSTESYNNPDKINYFDNFELILGIQNPNKEMEINDKIFYVKANIFTTTVNETGSFNTRESINIEPCDKVKPSNSTDNIFRDYDLKNYYCISENQPIGKEQIYINEFWGNNKFRMLQIKIYDCKNTTENGNKCAPKEKIDSFLNLTQISLYIVDNLVQTRNYTSPFKKNLRNYFFYVSHNFHLSITQYIHHITVFSDDGLLFTTSIEKGGFKLEEMIDYTIYQRDSDNFVSFSIQLNNIMDGYYRKYYKLQDLAAQAGGIYKALCIAAFIFTMLFEEASYYTTLINSFYNVDTKEIPREDRSMSTNQMITIKMSNTRLPYTLKNDNASLNTGIGINFIKKKTQYQKLSISFTDKLFALYLQPRCCRRKKKNVDILYHKGKSNLDKELDIIKVVKVMFEFNLFKKYTMNEEQYTFFDSISRPNLNLVHSIEIELENVKRSGIKRSTVRTMSSGQVNNYLVKNEKSNQIPSSNDKKEYITSSQIL